MVWINGLKMGFEKERVHHRISLLQDALNGILCVLRVLCLGGIRALRLQGGAALHQGGRSGRTRARSKALIHAHRVSYFLSARDAIRGQRAASKLRFCYVAPAILSGARDGRRETRANRPPEHLVYGGSDQSARKKSGGACPRADARTVEAQIRRRTARASVDAAGG